MTLVVAVVVAAGGAAGECENETRIYVLDRVRLRSTFSA